MRLSFCVLWLLRQLPPQVPAPEAVQDVIPGPRAGCSGVQGPSRRVREPLQHHNAEDVQCVMNSHCVIIIILYIFNIIIYVISLVHSKKYHSFPGRNLFPKNYYTLKTRFPIITAKVQHAPCPSSRAEMWRTSAQLITPRPPPWGWQALFVALCAVHV